MNEEEKERIERIRKYGDLLTRSGTSTSLEKELQLSAFNRYVGDMYDKTKKYADEEFEMITGNRREDTATTSRKEPTIQDVVDFVRNPVKTVSDSFSQGIADVKNNMIDKSREENTLLNAYNAVGKRMVENYENMTPEEYYKDQLLRQRLEDEIKKQNSGILKATGNWINTGLRGIQSHVANAESALFAAATNNPATDLGARLTLGENATEENVEKVKQQMYGNLRENWISQGEKDIARQQQLNDVAYDGVAKMAMDAAFTVGDMTIPILAGIATSGVASEANVGADAAAKIAQATSLGSMYTSVYGGSYKEALDAGATTRAADMYAHAMALIEIGTELIGGETLLSMMAGKPVNSLLGKLTKGKLSTVRNRLVKGLVAGFIDIGGESVEEALSAIVSPIARKAILGGEDINMPDYFAGIYQDAIGAILPTAILVGVGRPALLHQINTKEAETIDYIKKEADFIPKEVKGDLIRKIQEVTADARFGINENYTKVYDAVYDELRKANAKNAEIFNNVDLLERSINRSGQPIITPSLQDTLQNRPQAQTAQLSPRDLGRLAQQQGYVYEPYTGETTQELLDYSKKVPVTYSNMEQINDEIAQAMAEDSDIISITPVTEINQVEQNFKDILEKKYPNKQVVYADIQSKPGTVFRGLTSNNDTNTIILKAGQSAKDLLGSGYHEIGHQAKISNPTLYNEFIKEAGLEGENNAKVNEYRDAWGLEGYDDDAIREEMFGNYLGEINTKPENVANVEESTRTMFDNLKELGNKVANKAVGSEINNTRLTAYNLEGNTYMNGDIINNEEFEKHAIEELNGTKEETKPAPKKLAPQPKVETTPEIAEATIEDEESEVEKNLKQIRERIKQGNLKQKIDIDKAIADVLKIPYKLNDRNIKKYSELLSKAKFSKSALKTTDDEPHIVKRKFRKTLKDVGYINVNGTTLETIDDLAEICQVFRSNKNETMRVLFAKDGVTIGQKAFTSLSLNATYLPTDFFTETFEYGDKLGADSMYLMHNHPSGDVTASREDTNITKLAKQYWSNKFKGHIIIDHNVYTYLNYNSTLDKLTTEENLPLKAGKNNTLEENMNNDPWTEIKITSNREVAELASMVANSKDYSTLIFANAKNKATALVEVPNNFLQKGYKEINKYIKKVAEENGANSVFLGTTSTKVFADLEPFAYIRDCVLYTGDALNLTVLASKAQGSWPQSMVPSQVGYQKELKEKPKTKFSAQKTEKDTDKIIKNQRNEIASQEKKIEQLTEKNKTQREDIAELEKQLRKDNRSYQQAIKVKGYKLEKQGNKLQAQTEKNKTMKEYTDILKYEKTFIRHAGASQYRFDTDDMLRYTMLRVVDGMNDSKAWKATLEFKEAMSYIPKKLRGALESINWFLSPKIYNKLPNELKEQVDEYKKFYRKNITITPKMMTNMKAISDYIKDNLLNQKPVTKAVLNKVLPTDDAPIALSDIIKTKEEADAFVKKVAELDSAIKAERERKIKVEDAAKLFPKVTAPLDELDGQLIAKKKEEPIGIARKIDKAKKQIYTLKTEIESVYGGDPNTPALFFERNLQKGERGKRTVINAAYDFFKDFMQESKGLNGLMKMYRWKPEYEKLFAHNAEWKEWVKGTPKMPKSFILSLYLHRNNDQNLAHITGAVTSVKVDEDGKVVPHERKGGGIRLPNERQYKAGEIADAYKNGTNKKLTLQQVDALIGTLTKEEKAFADKVKAFYEYTTDLINEVSNRVFGYDLATVENYFPIHAYLLEQMYSNKEFDVETLLNGYKAEFTNLFNQGQLKERTDSFAPIYLENLVDVLSKSVNDISTFYGYAEPLRENDIVLKYVFHDGKQREANSIETQLNKLDPDIMDHYKSIVRFITGADGFGKRTFRNWQAINTLTFNVGTWLTQPASFMNTMKYYDTTGDFVKALASSHTKVNQMIRDYYERAGVDTKGMSNFELMRFFVSEATPILDARALNFRIPGLNELIDKKLNDKMKAKFLQFFDDIAVSTIARMQIYNTAAQAEFGTTEYFEKLRDNLELAMGETQPDSSPVNKANIFRNKNVFAQSLSLFGTPANQIANNFVQSTINLKYALQNGNKEQQHSAWNKFAKMIGGVIASNLWVALVRSLRDVVRSDDEDEVEFADRFRAQFLISALSPTLVGDEVASWIMSKAKYGGVSFYDLDTPDTAFVNNVFGAANKITNLFNEEISPTKKVVDTIKAIGSVAPIDTRSLIHDTEAMLKYFFPDTYKTYSLSKNTDIYKAWKKNPDTPMAEFYAAYTATRQKELEKLGYHKADKDKKIESNLKETREKALKGVFKDNAKVKKYMEILFGYKD